MNAEDPLRALAALPRPRLSPFFPARVTANVSSGPGASPRVASRLMRLYWLLVACVAVSLLSRSVVGLGILAFAGAIVASPGGVVRRALPLVAGLARQRR